MVPPIVADYLEGFNQRSVERMSACLAASATYHNLSYPESFQGRQVSHLGQRTGVWA